MNITICQQKISFWTHTYIYLLFRIVKAYKFLFKNKVGLRIQITTSLLSFIALSVMIQMPLREKNNFCLIQFEKPGRKDDFDYPEMAKEAGLNFNEYLSKLDNY